MIFLVVLSIAISVILLWLKVESKRLKISILLGLGISILSLFSFIIFAFFPQRVALWSLLVVFYVSLIVFLFLWNNNNSKKIFYVFFAPVICVIAGMAIIGHHIYVNNIPAVQEQSYFRRYYEPFYENNSLARLESESTLRLHENLPVLDGATALFPVYASFVQAVYSETEFRNSRGILLNSGTAGAFNNLLEGRADIIFCSAPSGFQIEQFQENGLNLQLIPIGMEAFVFFVNINNIIDNLTVENIQDIYSGRINNWRELNGANNRIRAFQRQANSGSQTALENIMGNVPIMPPLREEVSDGMFGIINRVADYRNFPNAIGFSFLYFTTQMVQNEQIKLLSINGIFPSRETIQDGSYPFSDNFYAIFIDTDDGNENIEFFIDWILSSQGQMLISKTGYIPIKNE
ncbi:MAG: substrate-binding domain-containing protein [Treponema sp.]|nr:substrate-binding domain-containing protein [Treponema sp.]